MFVLHADKKAIMHYLLYNILLTKIFNLMKKTMFFMVVFFFIGMVSINAQYVSNDEAIILLKAEIQELEAEAQNAPPAEAHDIAFQYIYYRAVAYDIAEGSEIGAAIQNNKPIEKGVPLAPGLTHFVTDDNYKASLEEVLIAIEDLLTD